MSERRGIESVRNERSVRSKKREIENVGIERYIIKAIIASLPIISMTATTVVMIAAIAVHSVHVVGGGGLAVYFG